MQVKIAYKKVMLNQDNKPLHANLSTESIIVPFSLV